MMEGSHDRHTRHYCVCSIRRNLGGGCGHCCHSGIASMPHRAETRSPGSYLNQRRQFVGRGHTRSALAACFGVGIYEASLRPTGGSTMIAFMLILYSSIVLLLFRCKVIKPGPYPIAIIVVGGMLIIGGVVVVWMQ